MKSGLWFALALGTLFLSGGVAAAQYGGGSQTGGVTVVIIPNPFPGGTVSVTPTAGGVNINFDANSTEVSWGGGCENFAMFAMPCPPATGPTLYLGIATPTGPAMGQVFVPIAPNPALSGMVVSTQIVVVCLDNPNIFVNLGCVNITLP